MCRTTEIPTTRMWSFSSESELDTMSSRVPNPVGRFTMRCLRQNRLGRTRSWVGFVCFFTLLPFLYFYIFYFTEVTIIPTYDTDVLGYWVSENEDLLAKYHIDLSPSASRCTINLQDHETSCSAYRLEF